jgi:hypothetical protein
MRGDPTRYRSVQKMLGQPSQETAGHMIRTARPQRQGERPCTGTILPVYMYIQIPFTPFSWMHLQNQYLLPCGQSDHLLQYIHGTCEGSVQKQLFLEGVVRPPLDKPVHRTSLSIGPICPPDKVVSPFDEPRHAHTKRVREISLSLRLATPSERKGWLATEN